MLPCAQSLRVSRWTFNSILPSQVSMEYHRMQAFMFTCFGLTTWLLPKGTASQQLCKVTRIGCSSCYRLRMMAEAGLCCCIAVDVVAPWKGAFYVCLWSPCHLLQSAYLHEWACKQADAPTLLLSLQMYLPKQGFTNAGSIREVYNLYTDNTLSVTSITTVKGQTEKCIQVGMAMAVTYHNLTCEGHAQLDVTPPNSVSMVITKADM